MKNLFILSLLAFISIICYANSPLFGEYQNKKTALEKKWDKAETQIEMNCVMGELAELATDYMYKALDYRLSQSNDSNKRISLLKEQSEWDWYCNKFCGESKRGGSIFPMEQGSMHRSRCEQRTLELLLSDRDYAILKEIQQLSVLYANSETSLKFSELLDKDVAIARISKHFGKIGKYHYAVIEPTKYLCCGEENPSEHYLVIWSKGKFHASYLIGKDIAINKVYATVKNISITYVKKRKQISQTFLFNKQNKNMLKFTVYSD